MTKFLRFRKSLISFCFVLKIKVLRTPTKIIEVESKNSLSFEQYYNITNWSASLGFIPRPRQLTQFLGMKNKFEKLNRYLFSVQKVLTARPSRNEISDYIETTVTATHNTRRIDPITYMMRVMAIHLFGILKAS